MITTHPVLADEPSRPNGARILGWRYRRTLRFAAWLFARVLLWELVLRNIVGEERIRRGRTRRLRRWAREFRALAVDMGGVMIKLGQFVSSRVDILPPEVIEELASLQDEVPVVPFPQIRAVLEADLGPPETRFASFESVPVAAASLGQAHRAQLPDGTRVIVKVQRPGIRTLVHTDLAALAVVARWAMYLRFIARRANVPALLDEFSVVLWEELDYAREAGHAEAFAQMFADNRGVYIPRLYRDYSTPRVVTLEDVTAIKITDFARIEAAGIDRRDVARRLINTYLWMVFDRRYYHADPHPGNLFIYPLEPDSATGSGYPADGSTLYGRPFYLIFVDFGMVGRLTPEIVEGLTETLVALTTRDARRLIESYQRLGVLLPGADLSRIEQAARSVFDRVWGMSMAEITTMPVSEMTALGREFSDLLFALPFQVPQDFLYLARCVAILSGLCTGLDPAFDPWREVAPFAQSLLTHGATGDPLPAGPLRSRSSPASGLNPLALRALLAEDNRERVLAAVLDTARRLADLPAVADDVLRRADRGDLTIRAAPSPELEQQIKRLEGTANRLAASVVFAGMAVSSAILYAAGEQSLSAAGLVLAGITFFRVVIFR